MRMTPPEVIAEIDKLLADSTDRQVADILNQRGFHSGTGESFSARTVARLRREYDLSSHYDRLRARGYLTVEGPSVRVLARRSRDLRVHVESAAAPWRGPRPAA